MNRNTVIKGIAAFQVYGGAAVAFQIVATIPSYDWNFFSIFILIFLAAFAVLAFFAGLQLWADEPGGTRLSVAAQAIQTPLISTTYLVYNVIPTFGLGLGFLYPPFDFGLTTYATPSLQIFVLRQVESGNVGVSVVPLLCLWYLLKNRASRSVLPKHTPET